MSCRRAASMRAHPQAGEEATPVAWGHEEGGLGRLRERCRYRCGCRHKCTFSHRHSRRQRKG